MQVKVEGTVSMGKDVIESLSQFLGNALNGRRSMTLVSENPIIDLVRTAVVCHNIAFCDPLRKFVEEYLAVLAMSLKTILNGMLKENFNEIAFEQRLKQHLEITRNIIEHANSNVTIDNEAYYWIDTIKKVCARFQDMGSTFAIDVLQTNPKEMSKIKEELISKIIIGTALVEIKYQSKLCVEYYICTKSFEVTKSLNTLLERFKTTHDDKVRLFIRYLHETLFDTAFYSHVEEKTGHELQIILNDMAYSNEVPTKEILGAVRKIVKARLEAVETKPHDPNITSHDAFLVHVILSDMDHVYSVYKTDPFKEFFQYFYNWLDVDVKIDAAIRQVVKNIGEKLKTAHESLLRKLKSEVAVFLKITVGPENKENQGDK